MEKLLNLLGFMVITGDEMGCDTGNAKWGSGELLSMLDNQAV